MKNAFLVVLIIVGFFMAVGFLSDTQRPAGYTVINPNNKIRAIALDTSMPSEEYLASIGHAECNGSRYCVLWFFTSEADAKNAAEQIQAGNLDASSPYLMGIFSKNNTHNELICYQIGGGC